MNHLAERELNMFLTPARRLAILTEVNEALAQKTRLFDQIKIWQAKPLDNLCTKIVQDELIFLRDGKV